MCPDLFTLLTKPVYSRSRAVARFDKSHGGLLICRSERAENSGPEGLNQQDGIVSGIDTNKRATETLA